MQLLAAWPSSEQCCLQGGDLPISSVCQLAVFVTPAWPGHGGAVQVEGALRALSHAQAAFSNCHQPAGALETLSWSLAAQPGCAGTTAQPQEPPGAGATPDMLKGLDKAKQAVELLQVLASVTGEQGGQARAQCILPRAVRVAAV